MRRCHLCWETLFKEKIPPAKRRPKLLKSPTHTTKNRFRNKQERGSDWRPAACGETWFETRIFTNRLQWMQRRSGKNRRADEAVGKFQWQLEVTFFLSMDPAVDATSSDRRS